MFDDIHFLDQVRLEHVGGTVMLEIMQHTLKRKKIASAQGFGSPIYFSCFIFVKKIHSCPLLVKVSQAPFLREVLKEL